MREGSSSTEATSLKDNSSVAMALLFLPVHAERVADETKQTEAVWRVEVVTLVLTKNTFGSFTTSSAADLYRRIFGTFTKLNVGKM